MNHLTDIAESIKRWFGRHSGEQDANRAIALDVLQRQQRRLRRSLRRREVIRRKLQGAISFSHTDQMHPYCDELASLARDIELLESLNPEPSRVEAFSFSSAMLLDSYRLCTETADEGMHFILGIDVDGVGVGTRIVTFPYSHRSIAGAGGKHDVTHRIVINAHETGHRVLAILHSHPGSGTGANHPSGTDRNTHSRWEQGGFRMVGGIWARDGYLRWFSSRLELEVRVVGNHFERIDQNVWQIQKTKELDLPAA